MAEVEREVDRATLDSFLALDLLRIGNPDCSHYSSSVFLYPVGNLLIASDYYNQSSGPDSVFPAIQTGTLRLLSLLPESSANDGLDLCSGTGVCAFAMSQRVKRIVACDITERATHFARFNRLLNNCTNVEIAKGDLYCAVAGSRFDRIVAHPPYAPSAEAVEVWRDGGATGEAVTKRIIEGLPDSLNPGGEFFAVCLGGDRREMPFERRAREWLGEKQREFDIIWAVQKDFLPHELAQSATAREGPGVDDDQTARLEEAFHELGVSSFSFGCLGLKRHGAEARNAWTFRTRLSSKSDSKSFETAFERNRQCSEPAAVAELRPRLAPALLVKMTHRVEQSKLVPDEFRMECDWPFAHGLKADPWVLPLIARFNGSLKVAKIHAKARADGAVPDGFHLEHFASLVATMMRYGYLTAGE